MEKILLCHQQFYGSLDLTDVRLDGTCDILTERFSQFKTHKICFVLNDSHPCFVIRRLDVRKETGLET